MVKDDLEQILALMEGYVPEAVRRELHVLQRSDNAPVPQQTPAQERLDQSGQFSWPWDTPNGLVIARGGGGGGGAEGGKATIRSGGRGGGGGLGGKATRVFRSNGQIVCAADGGRGGNGGNGGVPAGMPPTPGYPGDAGGLVVVRVDGLTKGESLDVHVGTGGAGGVCEGDHPGEAGSPGKGGFVMFVPLAAA